MRTVSVSKNTKHRYTLSHSTTFTFPFSAHRCTSLSWVGWKKRFTDNETAELKVEICTQQTAATSITQIKHIDSDEFVPLASPVESSEIRSTCAARPSNIVHIFSHSTPEQMMITTSSPRVDSTSVQHPEHPHASQAAASPT